MTDADRIRTLLRAESTLALATCGVDGAPQVAPLFYIAGGNLELYWFSSASSLHSRNVQTNGAAAVTIYRPADEWQEIRGVQMRGVVSVIVDSARRDAVTRSYVERFRLGVTFHDAIASSNLYSFQPAWVRYIDNSLGFGYSVEIAL